MFSNAQVEGVCVCVCVCVCVLGRGVGHCATRSCLEHVRTDIVFRPVLLARWANPRDAVVHMMHNGWGNVQYTVESMNPSNRTMRFERGGYQHGRGGAVGVFFVENQLELLDAPGEW